MKIAFLVIATHKYIRFAQPLYDSIKKHVKIPNAQIDMFVFTNQPEVPKGCIRVEQEHRPFPYPTLMRYYIFDKNKKLYSNYDYIYYLDADMLIVGDVGPEILTDRLGVLHPCFFSKPRSSFSYEKDSRSTACIRANEGTHYFCGGFNGGSAKCYLEMCKTIANNVDKDEEKGVVAIWHDESHLNRYYVDNPPTKILDPSYCYPGDQFLNMPKVEQIKKDLARFPKRIIALDKDKKEVRN